MVALLIQLLLAIRSRLTRRARLEAENLILRQQLVILRRKFPRRVRLHHLYGPPPDVQTGGALKL
jgi:hypothetical protein